MPGQDHLPEAAGRPLHGPVPRTTPSLPSHPPSPPPRSSLPRSETSERLLLTFLRTINPRSRAAGETSAPPPRAPPHGAQGRWGFLPFLRSHTGLQEEDEVQPLELMIHIPGLEGRRWRQPCLPPRPPSSPLPTQRAGSAGPTCSVPAPVTTHWGHEASWHLWAGWESGGCKAGPGMGGITGFPKHGSSRLQQSRNGDWAAPPPTSEGQRTSGKKS